MTRLEILNNNKVTGGIGISGIFILFCLGACDTVREISIEVMVPAEITIPSHIQSVTFANRSNMPWLAKDPNDTLKRPPEDLYILDTIVNNKIFLGLFDALNSSPLFDLKELSAVQLRRTDPARFPEPLSQEEIQILADTIPTDAFICLEGYRATDSTLIHDIWESPWLTYNLDYYEDPDIGVVYYVEGTIQWRIYDGLYGMILDEFSTTDTMEWTVYGTGDIEASMNELPEVVDAYREYAYERGYDFGMRISPSWSPVRRFYFITGSQNIRKAAEFVNKGKWEEAAVLWKKETDSTKPKIAAKTSFNMALYCERKDLIIPAIDWATKSYEVMQEKYTKTYINILEKRKLNKLKLQEQIPLE
jgi:hypothetical protein